jgi:hypothetical protein
MTCMPVSSLDTRLQLLQFNSNDQSFPLFGASPQNKTYIPDIIPDLLNKLI